MGVPAMACVLEGVLDSWRVVCSGVYEVLADELGAYTGAPVRRCAGAVRQCGEWHPARELRAARGGRGAGVAGRVLGSLLLERTRRKSGKG